MAMQALRDGASNGFLKFFLFGLLALAGGGLVFTDVGGFFRGGVGGNDVAKIGKQTISIQNFDSIARRTLARMNMTPAQAFQFGYLNQILNTELQRRALMIATQDAGITIGDDYVLEQISDVIKPATQTGVTTEEALTNFLRSNGITQPELVTSIKTEKALGIFGEAMESGALLPPNGLAERVYQYNNETRDIRYIPFPTADLTDIAEPNESELQALYNQTKEFYAIPETRTITVATLDIDKLEQNIEISQEDVQNYYDDYIDNYVSPAARTITQAIFQDEENANKAKETLTSDNFETKAKDSNAEIIPLKNVTQNDVLDELKEPVFSAENTGIIGPVETPFGYTIIKLSQINEEYTEKLDDVAETITDELKEEQLIDQLYDTIEELDNFLAGGNTLDEAKKQFPLKSTTFENLNRFGRTKDNKDPLNNDYETGAQTLIQTAFSLENEGKNSNVEELPDGTFFIVHIDTITPKTYTPFEDLQKTLKRKWTTKEQNTKNEALVMSLLQESNNKSFDTIAKEQGKSFKKIRNIKRVDDESPLMPEAKQAVLDAKEGDVFTVRIKSGLALAQLTEIHTPKMADTPSGDTQKELDTIEKSIVANMQNELLSLYLKQLNDKYPAKINTELLERAYGQSTEDDGY